MQRALRKNLHHSESAKAARIICRVFCFHMVFFLVSQYSFAFDFKDLKQSFATDFKRPDATQMEARFASAISGLSGMKLEKHVNVVFKSRGDVKQERFELDIKSQNMADESSFSGYEYLMKQFQLVKGDVDLKEFLLDSMYDNVYGFYDPVSKNMVIMERATAQVAAAILLHELMHAAQDFSVNLKEFQEKNCKTVDSCMAAAALIEGQASSIDLLMRIEQNLQDKTSKEVLKSVYERMQSSGDQVSDKDRPDFLSEVRFFPYLEGLKFVTWRYINDESFTSMFERAPVSTAQVLHPEKFEANLNPIPTELSGKKTDLAAVPGAKLILDSTLGEYYIRTMFSHILKDDPKRIKEMAAGWGGDAVCVFQNEQGRFFIWDTLWETAKSADEFFQIYLDSSKVRYNAPELQANTKSGIRLNIDKNSLHVKKVEKRVLIVEGELSPSQMDSIEKILGPM